MVSAKFHKIFPVCLAKQGQHVFCASFLKDAFACKADNERSADIVYTSADIFVVRRFYTDAFAQLVRGRFSLKPRVVNQHLHYLPASNIIDIKPGAIRRQPLGSFLEIQ